MKIVVLDGYTENPGDLSWDALRQFGDLTVYDRTSYEESPLIAERMQGADIVVMNKTPISRQTIDCCPDLKLIAVLATGFNVVDIDYAREKGIPVVNVPVYGTASVSQFAIALLLEICHHIGYHNDTVKSGKWEQCPDWCYWDYPLIELAGKTYGLLGCGNIGIHTAAIASALGMHVIAYDTRQREEALALGVERTGLEPIVMKAEEGDPDKAIYHSVFITNSANDDINSIEDIKGRTMAFVDPDSTSGNLVPTAEIIQAFPDDNLNSDMLHTNGDFFEAVSFSGSHQAGLQAVVKGDVDVAPISDQILASEIANGNANESDVKIIHESGAIPAEAMVVAEHVDQETRDMLTEFLTSYDNEQYFTDVIKVPGARFIECDMSDYQEIIELNKIINEF